MMRRRTEYPVVAIRKAILNALIHRGYGMHAEGIPIQIIMFEDRLEIRNSVITSELEVLKITENRHSGISTIRKAMNEYS